MDAIELLLHTLHLGGYHLPNGIIDFSPLVTLE